MRKKIAAAFLAFGCLGVVASTTPSLAAMPSGAEMISLRLLTESEYRHSISDIFGAGVDVKGLFEPGVRMGGLLSTSSTVLSVTPAGFEAFTKMADSIAGQALNEKNRTKLVSCAPKSPAAPDQACATQFFSNYGLLLYRRPLTNDELKSLVALAEGLTNSSHDFYAGLRIGLKTLLSSPNFLFRVEYAVPSGGKDYTLDGYSRASRLSYLMWDSTPDSELLHVAQTGELNTPAGVAKQVDRMMASPRLETGMRAFFTDFLELQTFENTTKDSVIYPQYFAQVAPSAQEETLRTVIDLSLNSNEDLRDIMTTRKTYINRVLASIYDVPFDFKVEWMPYEFSEDSGRSGVLTQVSFLAMFSHPGRSSPTERGVALMDIFLCEPTPQPPANVDFSVVNNTSNPKLRTVRDRLLAHATNPTCASCHTHSDPIGLSLEQFDSVGVHRVKDNGDVIDVSGALGTKHFNGATGLGQAIHDDPKFPVCLARKLYSYAVGANSEDVDRSMFTSAYKSFVADGYHLRSLLKSLANSVEFFSAPPPAGNSLGAKTAMNISSKEH